MMKARDRVLQSRWVAVDELAVAAYYADLYPLPRDLSGLRWSFARHGYRPEYPIVVRASGGGEGTFEIVCGVGRHTVARERGMRRVPIVVLRRFNADDNATRAYTIEDNLFNQHGSARLSLAHMLVLARTLKECGVACAPRQIWTAAGVSASTYWRADRCLNRSLAQVLLAHPELAGLDCARQVAEIIRHDLAPHLTRLFAGGVEVNTYHRSQGGRREQPTRQVERKVRKARSGGVPRAPLAADLAKPSQPVGMTLVAAKKTGRKQAAQLAQNDANPSLFDLLPS